MGNWFEIDNIEEIDSPSIALYEDRLMHNLHEMLDMVGNDACIWIAGFPKKGIKIIDKALK